MAKFNLTKKSEYTAVSCKYTPNFATLASVQNAGGYLYAICDDFSRDYAPSPLPVPIKNDLIVGGDKGPSTTQRQARGGDAPDVTGRLKSFNVEGQGSRALPRSSCMSCPSLMRAVPVRSRHFNGRQPSGLGKHLILR